MEVRITLSKDTDYTDFEMSLKRFGDEFKVTDLAQNSRTITMTGAKIGETYEFFRRYGKLHYKKVIS